MHFATVKSGPRAGEFVRYNFAVGNPAVRVTAPPAIRSVTGYGRKLPTRYMVRTIDQRWRRVWCCCFSNVGTCYIVQDGENIIVEMQA